MRGPGVFLAVLRRPPLWGEALRAALAMAPRAWWSRGSRLPTPEPEYLAWRRATAYGDADQPTQAADVVDYLQWRRRFRRATTTSRGAIGG